MDGSATPDGVSHPTIRPPATGVRSSPPTALIGPANCAGPALHTDRTPDVIGPRDGTVLQGPSPAWRRTQPTPLTLTEEERAHLA